MSVLPGRMLAVAAWNAALAVTAIAALAPELPEPVRMGAVSVLVLVLPGVAWLGAFRRALDPPRLALAVFGGHGRLGNQLLGQTQGGIHGISSSRPA